MMHDESSPPVRASLAPFGVEQEYESMRYLGVNFHILQLLPISFATQKKKKKDSCCIIKSTVWNICKNRIENHTISYLVVIIGSVCLLIS